MSPPAAPVPLDDSYWLIEGRLLAGEYPGHWNEKIARDQLTRLLDAGIRSFIDLTETKDPLEPYEDLVQELAAERGIEVRYQRLPIRDMDVPTSERMNAILDTIQAEAAAGRPVYFHCWGGIGRTGTVAACWLREQGQTCDDAFACIKELRERPLTAGRNRRRQRPSGHSSASGGHARSDSRRRL